MERVLTSGPELAKGPSMFPCTPAQDEGAPRSAEVAARVRRALRRPGGGDLYAVAFFLAVAAMLVATGYPARRIALVALVGVVLQVGSFARRRRMQERQCVNANVDQIASRVVLHQAP